MNISNLIGLLSGLALFLYGISLMGDGLSKVAGDRLQKILYQLTSNPVRGILLGIAVTALIQSSSATSVMAIGFSMTRFTPRFAHSSATVALFTFSQRMYATSGFSSSSIAA